MDLATWISQNEKLIYKLASYFSDYASIEDLYQTAVIGLINAYKNYKDDKQTKFSSYAYFYMKGEVKKYIRESNISNEQWDSNYRGVKTPFHSAIRKYGTEKRKSDDDCTRWRFREWQNHDCETSFERIP